MKKALCVVQQVVPCYNLKFKICLWITGKLSPGFEDC